MSEMRALMLETLDRVLADALTPAARQQAETGALPAGVWSALEAAGLTAVGVAGGDDALPLGDCMAVVARTAWHGAPVPLAETVLARWLLSRAGIAAPKGAITVVPPATVADVRLEAGMGLGRLQGTASRVPWARSVPHAILAADGQLVLAGIGGAVTAEAQNAAGEPRDTVDLARAKVVANAPLADAAARVEAGGALIRSVQMSGALARALDLALAWANDRVQFGRPIAKFQAVQHMLAALAAEVAAAGAAADLAVEASTHLPDRLAVAIAKSRTGDAAGRGAAIAHQVLGALGFTREHQLHTATRRLWAWREEFGSEVHWQAELGRAFAQGGADAIWPRLTALGDGGTAATSRTSPPAATAQSAGTP